MTRVLCILVAALALVFAGCESQDQTETKTAPHQVVKPDKPIKAEEEKPVEVVKEKVEEVVKKTEEVIEKSSEKVVKATEETVAVVKEEASIAVANVATATAKKMEEVKTAVTPDEIVLEASYGNVTFSHGKHAGANACETCHEGSPAPFDLTKDVAHKLCKGCHKDGGAGPTSCNDCHKK